MRFSVPAVLLAVLLFAASCGGTKQAVYFSEDLLADTTIRTEIAAVDAPTIIKKDDILAINVSSISSVTPEADPVRVFREGGTQFGVATQSAGSAGGGAQNTGYLVDAEGLIDFPVLGKIKMEGLTIRQAKEELIKRLKLYVKDPVVEVRIINYKVVVLGEVNRPGTVLAPNHKMTVLEAIAAAGDIPISGKKDNILVIRQTENGREYARLNFNNRDVFRSPYFNLQQNDIVIVEPTRTRRQANNNFTQIYLPIITSLLTVGLTIFTVTRVSNDKL